LFFYQDIRSSGVTLVARLTVVCLWLFSLKFSLQVRPKVRLWFGCRVCQYR